MQSGQTARANDPRDHCPNAGGLFVELLDGRSRLRP